MKIIACIQKKKKKKGENYAISWILFYTRNILGLRGKYRICLNTTEFIITGDKTKESTR